MCMQGFIQTMGTLAKTITTTKNKKQKNPV